MMRNIIIALLLFNIVNAEMTKSTKDYIIKYQKESLETADKFGSLLCKHKNNIEKVSTLNTIMINYAGIKRYFNLNDNQIILGLMSNTKIWMNVKLIKISNSKIKQILGIKQSETLASMNDAYDSKGKYKLIGYIQKAKKIKPKLRTTFDKELLVFANKYDVLYFAFYGDMHKLFPIQNDKNKTWLNPEKAMKQFTGKNKKAVTVMINMFIANVTKSNYKEANKYLDLISRYQKTFSKRTDILKNAKTLTDVNKLPQKDIEELLNNSDSIESLVKGMAYGINRRIKINKGAIVVDYITSIISATHRDNILIQKIELNKELFIEQYVNELKISKKQVEKAIFKMNVKKDILKEMKQVTVNSYCSVPLYKTILKRKAIFELIYQFDNGEIFGSFTINHIDCLKNKYKK